MIAPVRLLAACVTVGLGLAISPAASATVTPITTQTDGNNPGTLRYAISHAAGTDTVDVPPGTYKLTLGTAISPPPGLTIAGAGASSTTIDGGGGSTILYASGSLTVSGITFTHGMATQTGGNGGGGAITVNGPGALTVSGSAFNANAASITNADFSGGGAIYVNGGASANVAGSTFSGNTVTANGLDNDGGGAIFVSGALTLSSDTFTGDTFTLTNASSTGTDGGGAVFSTGATTISGSTFRGESASVSALTPNSVSNTGGGAVWSGGGSTVTASTFSGDTATVNRGFMLNGGGGIYSMGGPLSITGSTLSSNHVVLSLLGLISNGGGGAYNDGTTTTIVNTTMSGNTVSAAGGISNAAGGGAYYDYGTGGGTISSSTIDGNSVAFPGGIADAGGLYELGTGGTLALRNTIVSGNSVSGAVPLGKNCYAGGGTTITSAGHNIEDANSCNLIGPGDQPNTNPALGPLQDNGGPVFTQALSPGSPAIDRGDNTGCPATDARGVTRPQGGSCDIGAYEVGVADLRLTASATPNPVAVGKPLTYVAVATNAGPAPTNAALVVTLPSQVALQSATPTQGSCHETGNTLACALGELNPGATARATIVVAVRAAGFWKSTFVVSAADIDPTPTDNTATVGVTALAVPVLSAVKQSTSKWHEGSRLAHLSAKSKRRVGTTFSFKLSEAARVTFSFSSGSHARGKLTVTAKAGSRKLRFQGRLSRSKRLKPGRYKVTITATDALGQRSRPHTLRFTILKH